MPDAKICGTCKRKLSVADFAWHSGSARSRPGYRKLRSYCKKCGDTAATAWRKKHHSAVLVYNKRYREKKRGEKLTPLIVRLAPGARHSGKASFAIGVEQSYEDWKHWRFSPEFLRLEEELGGVNTWEAMYQLCEEGSAPEVAAKALCQTATDAGKSAAKWKALRHPWETN